MEDLKFFFLEIYVFAALTYYNLQGLSLAQIKFPSQRLLTLFSHCSRRPALTDLCILTFVHELFTSQGSRLDERTKSAFVKDKLNKPKSKRTRR